MKVGRRNFLLILILGFLLRLCLSYFQYSGDLKNHLVWATGFLSTSLDFYSRHFTGYNDPNYPPFAIILFSFFTFLHQLINQLFSYLNQSFSIFPSFLIPLFQSENTSMLFLKLPGIFADIGSSIIIYKLTKKSLLATSLYLFNPAVIYLTSVWGQIEPVTIFFLLLSIYYLPQKSTLSLISLTLGILIKQTVLWFAPIIAIYYLKQYSVKQLAKDLSVSAVIFFLFYLPFGLLPLPAVSSYLSTLSGSSTVVSDAAWNLWHLIYGQGVEDSVLFFGLSIRSVSICLLVISFFVVSFRVKSLTKPLFIWSVLAFFLQTRVHERHLAFALPLFLISFPINTSSLLAFLSLSAYHLLNLSWSLKLPFV